MRAVLLSIVLATLTTSARPPTAEPTPVASPSCQALARHVREAGGTGPVLLVSYTPGPGRPLDASLTAAAFTYDNALSVIALTSCGQGAAARRVMDGLLLARAQDRTYRDGRMRNAYRAGPVGQPVALAGWWDAGTSRWVEDGYQAGTSVGNVLWAALAALTVFEATGEPRYQTAARDLLGWTEKSAADPRSPGGFRGGFYGHEPSPTRLDWRSTEHNIDAHAVAAWLTRESGGVDGETVGGHFVAAMWDPVAGRFHTGTGADGSVPADQGSALDVQLWPHLAFASPRPAWKRSLAAAERDHAVDGGFDFDGDRDGIWVEGTAQAAVAYRAVGRPDRARELLRRIESERSPSGLLYAASRDALTTGLAVGPDSAGADFTYNRWPHLGATAWGAMAEQGWNPFTGRRLPVR